MSVLKNLWRRLRYPPTPPKEDTRPAAWKTISAEDIVVSFSDAMSFAIMKDRIGRGEIRLEDTPQEFRVALSEEEREAQIKWEREKLVRETPTAPCPICKEPAHVGRESGPHEMGGSADWQMVSCGGCGLSVRKYDLLDAKLAWNRLPR